MNSDRSAVVLFQLGGPDSLDAIEPCWLADGRHLIYTAREANQRSLWILDTETRKTKRISPSALGQASQASYWIQ